MGNAANHSLDSCVPEKSGTTRNDRAFINGLLSECSVHEQKQTVRAVFATDSADAKGLAEAVASCSHPAQPETDADPRDEVPFGEFQKARPDPKQPGAGAGRKPLAARGRGSGQRSRPLAKVRTTDTLELMDGL
jgi:hypothetical protein